MPRSATFDPVDRFRWRVYVVNPAGAVFARAGFTSCSTPAITINYNTYPEGGSHMNPRKIADGAIFKPITMRRGVVKGNGADDFVKWMESAYKALNPSPGDGLAPQYRNDMVIEQLDRDATVVKRWYLRHCVPTFYEPASDFDAMGDNSVSVETLTFEYEGMEEERPDDLMNDVGDFIRRYTRGAF